MADRGNTGYFARRAAFNASQGYRVDYKYVGLAYVIEAAVVTTSLVAGWLFAKLYGHGDTTTMTMMMLAPIAYAGVEIARVPLALALRTQPNWLWKLLFGLMVLCAVAVSVKSLSQLGEVMFRPRLLDVTTATTALKDAQSARDAYAGKIAAADSVVAQRTKELATAEDRLKAVNSELGSLPADRCARNWHTNARGVRYSTQDCHTDGRQKVMAGNLVNAQAARDGASHALDDARGTRDALDATRAQNRVADLERARRDAVMNSQLHSFTGMFFGKDPMAVTDAELHNFLRIFVFFPAIFASLAATALALAAVTPLRRAPDPVEVDDLSLVDHLLAPMLRSVEVHAATAANEAVARSMASRGRIEPVAPAMAPDAGNAAQDTTPAASEPDRGAAASLAAAEPAAAEPSTADNKPVDDKPAPKRPTLVASSVSSGAA